MRGRRAALVVLGIGLAGLLGELSLRLVPFERLKYEARYGHFSGNAVSRFLEYDPVLTFRNRRNARFPDAGVTIDRFGLRGRTSSSGSGPARCGSCVWATRAPSVQPVRIPRSCKRSSTADTVRGSSRS